MNNMARIGIDKPPWNHLEPTRDRVEPVTYLDGGSGGQYEVASLMAPKAIPPWAHALLQHGERFQGSKLLVTGRHL